MTDTTPVIHPKFHHVNLKTTRLQEMIDFYGTLVGAEVVFQFDGRRVAVERRRQPPDRAAGVPELRRRPGEGHAAPGCTTPRSSTRASRS